MLAIIIVRTANNYRFEIIDIIQIVIISLKSGGNHNYEDDWKHNSDGCGNHNYDSGGAYNYDAGGKHSYDGCGKHHHDDGGDPFFMALHDTPQ